MRNWRSRLSELSAIWVVDGVASIESASEAVELEVGGSDLAVLVHIEDVDALDFILS